MRKTIALLLVAAAPAALHAQEPTQKTLASTLEMYVFPAKGQTASQQNQDEAACYQWAVQNTGSDPFALEKQKQAEQQQAQAEQQEAHRPNARFEHAVVTIAHLPARTCRAHQDV